MPIYLVIHEDRHIDVEVQPYRGRDDALVAARQILAEEEGQEEEINSAMREDGWLFYGPYGTEGDYVRVVERELH